VQEEASGEFLVEMTGIQRLEGEKSLLGLIIKNNKKIKYNPGGRKSRKI